ncbi:MAG TPA: hypothetical protein VF834_14615 [Streptosporangiaceae bacterium]
MRLLVRVIAVLSTAGLALTTAALPALATTRHSAACSTNWGTSAKRGGSSSTVSTPVKDVRVGKHGCFDRLVVDLGSGPRPPYAVQYVRQILAQGSGQTLSVRGKAKLLIIVRGPAARGYHSNAVNLADVSGFTTFRQVRGAGSFERITAIGLGTRAKLAFRVSLLGSSSSWRLVIDVAH